MNTRLKSEEEVLDPAMRKLILEEILGAENQRRKDASFRRYQAYKDKTANLVLEQLLKQFDRETVEEMSYAISNLSIARKIVNKLARVYSNGVVRDIAKDEAATKNLQDLERLIKFNEEIKRTNRYLRLQHNVAFYVRPCPGADGNWYLKAEALQPHLYDVVEEYYDRTKPMVFIISDYNERKMGYTTGNAATEGRGIDTKPIKTTSDGKDQTIADPDSKSQQFIWWTNSYHFTTDEKGIIIDMPFQGKGGLEESVKNPIQMLPMVSFAIDQDGKFWADGGDDLVDGSVLVNSMLSQVNHIAVIQGYGQFWMKGKNLPRNVKVGPSKAILMEWSDKEDPEPSIGFASASPNLDSLKGLVEFYVAMLLTTNNLSTSGVKATLQGSGDFASGVAMMIDKAESREDVQDQEQVFRDGEPTIWRIIAAWLEEYATSLAEEWKGKALPKDNFDLVLKFGQPTAIMTESERLDNLAKRKDLGINTLVDLILIDNPGMTQEEAEKKLLEIAKERASRMAQALINPQGQEPGVAEEDDGPVIEQESDEDDEDESVESENQL